MAIELSEEAFGLFYFVKERMKRCRDLIETDPNQARENLSEIITEVEEYLGPGVP